jgi:hypothetical protein
VIYNGYGLPLRKSQRLNAIRADAKGSSIVRPQTLGIAAAEAGVGSSDMLMTASPMGTRSKYQQERQRMEKGEHLRIKRTLVEEEEEEEEQR